MTLIVTTWLTFLSFPSPSFSKCNIRTATTTTTSITTTTTTITNNVLPSEEEKSKLRLNSPDSRLEFSAKHHPLERLSPFETSVFLLCFLSFCLQRDKWSRERKERNRYREDLSFDYFLKKRSEREEEEELKQNKKGKQEKERKRKRRKGGRERERERSGRK